jgi:exodeoxyribonuclease VII large subunit
MTDRLPFDPARMAAASKKPAPASDAPMTVSQLTGRIGTALVAAFPASVRVIGEVSGFRERTHWYFDLKDAEAVVSCAMFASAAKKLRFTPKNGQEVIVKGRVDFYAKQGRVSFIAERIEPVGAGALELAYRALCEELRSLGWLAQDRKRPIPAFPRRVAVVTSRSAAALQDVLDTMRRRCPATIVQLVDVRVQGDGAAAEIAAAIRWLSRRGHELGVEAILVTRGGGSMEDLWAFNERVVAEAIVGSSIPVVAAIGHETDTTIAELVADLRCATPTQAAMRLTPDLSALLEQLDRLNSRLASVMATELDQSQHIASMSRHLRLAMQGRIQAVATRLERLSGRLERHRPTALHARRAEALHRVEARLDAAIRARLGLCDVAPLAERLTRAWAVANERTATHLAALQKQLAAVGPMSVLRRGFSYTLLEDGRLLKTPSDAAPGDRLLTRLADGEVSSIVEGNATPPPPAPVTPAPQRPDRTKPRPAKTAPDQMDLFKPAR